MRAFRSCRREVISSNAAAEQYVAAEDDPFVAKDENDVAGGMAGDFANIHGQSGEIQSIAVADKFVRRRTDDFEAKRSAQIQIGIFEKRSSPAPIIKGTAGNAAFRSALPAMWSAWPWVLMIAAGASPRSDEEFENRVRLGAGIDYDRVLPAFVPDDVSVFGERHRNNCLDLQGHFISGTVLAEYNSTT